MSAPLTPGFMVLQGNHLENLRDILVQWLNEHPLSPLEDECILVQSNGIAQWLKMAIAKDDTGQGIAAAINVQLPGRFIWQAYRSVFTQLPTSSPYDKEPLTWRLYRLLSDRPALHNALGEHAHVLAPLERFLSADNDARRLYQLAAHLADLYDQYQLYRADWLEHWQTGQNSLISATGALLELDENQLWQPHLWRLINADVAAEHHEHEFHSASRAHINQAFIQACESYTEEQRPTTLPRRVIVFSISSLPRQTLELLQAISPFTQVLIFATNPCQHYWGDLIEGKDLLKAHYKRIQQNEQVAHLSLAEIRRHGHPLLASWGKQGRDFLHLLDEHDEPDAYRQLFTQQNIDVFTEPEGDQLLQQLQSDILNLRSQEERAELESVVRQNDDSLQFSVAHSRQREVEILHDQLLASFEKAQAQGRPLHPRDVIVMVPHIDEYAPHIEAVFGRYQRSGEHKDPRYLPYHITDQSQRGQNTLLIALEALLQLPRMRFTVSDIFDLLDTPSLRARFGLEEADLPLLRHWITDANIRWGLDAEQRASMHLPNYHVNTWLFGLERMLLGYATGNTEPWQGIQPYDEVSGLSAALVGPLSLLIQQLNHTQQLLSQAHSSEQWPRLIEQLLGDFFTPVNDDDEWALTQLELQLERLQDTWQLGQLGSVTLPLEVVREELLAGLDQPSLAQRFLAGSINFATLMPMRALPFRQVWILGMNDKEYPRQMHAPDFDLMANDYRPGDRSRREDDRYLFLEALLSAREKLAISWIGRDIRDNAELPPSVVVNQLRDHLAASWQGEEEDLLAQLTTEHPLQPFSVSYFEPQRDPRLFTYAKEWRDVHNPPSTAALNPHTLAHEHLEISTDELMRFMRAPVEYFYRHSLGIQWYLDDHTGLDTELFTPNGLDKWQLANSTLTLVTHELAQQPHLDIGTTLDKALEQQALSGSLPMGAFAQLAQQDVKGLLLTPLTQYQQHLQQYPERLPIATLVHTAHGVTLQDGLGDIRHHNGEYKRFVLQPSRLHSGNGYKFRHILRYWPAHVLAQLQHPVDTHLLGPDTHLILPACGQAEARALLDTMLEVYHLGIHELLPLPCETAFALFEGSKKAQDTYEGGFSTTGEVTKHPSYAKHWPDYETLAQAPQFGLHSENGEATLIERLYGPVYTLFNGKEPRS
ncbi:MAG TPA: exodeoxyribonuclease V subunit gamma [Alcanivoracaceae bacterium]|nr:exodeoxyribonuclease V subunit gamma [Alcanivoracaceae bacterium]